MGINGHQSNESGAAAFHKIGHQFYSGTDSIQEMILF
jgi:hypothetical protein